MRRVTAVLCAIVIGALAFLPARASAAVGGCAGGEDYNGDGFADLAIGVFRENVGALTDAGSVQVIYGGPGGVSSAGDQVFHQDSDGINGTAADSDFFGFALASGDFDGDGFDDLAVGVPFEDVGASNTGAVQIIYGSAAGLSSAGDQVFHRETADVDEDAGAGDVFGTSVAACDFDGDGLDDLAIGVPFDTVSGQSSAGSVQVLYGTPAGISAADDQVLHQDVLTDTAETSDFFGASLAAGHFDGDGFGDLAMGVLAEDLEAPVFVQDPGAVHVVYGGSSGLSDSGDDVFHQDSPGMNDTAEEFDNFGLAVASGDFNGDGFDDLAVGIPFEDLGVIGSAGAVQVVYGGPDGLSSSGDQVFHQDTDGMNDTAEGSDFFGLSLASGDFDGDGFDDLAVGIPFENVGVTSAGAVQIVYGTSAGLSSSADQVFHQDTSGMNDTSEDFDNLALTVTSGDLDSDGFDDVALGVPHEGVAGSADGAVQVVYGTSAGISSAGDQVFHQNSDGMNDTAEPNDHFGAGLVLSPEVLFVLA